jgi:hypothetical protein
MGWGGSSCRKNEAQPFCLLIRQTGCASRLIEKAESKIKGVSFELNISKIQFEAEPSVAGKNQSDALTAVTNCPPHLAVLNYSKMPYNI